MKKENMQYTIITIVAIVSLLAFAFGYEMYRRTDENIYNEDTHSENHESKNNESMSYEEFSEIYGKEIEKYDISEDNYKYYEEELYSEKYAKEISCEIKNCERDVYVFVTNHSDIILERVQVWLIFMNDEDEIIHIDSENISNIEPGQTQCYNIYVTNLNLSAESKYKFYYEVGKGYGEDNKLLASKIKTDFINDENNPYIRLTNDNDSKCKSISGQILFYDREENIIGGSSFFYYDKLGAGKSTKYEIHPSRNILKKYDSYKIFVNRVSDY